VSESISGIRARLQFPQAEVRIRRKPSVRSAARVCTSCITGYVVDARIARLWALQLAPGSPPSSSAAAPEPIERRSGQFGYFVQNSIIERRFKGVTSMSAVIRHAQFASSKLADSPKVSASAAKNGFGRILDRVAQRGDLPFYKHDEPCAVADFDRGIPLAGRAKELTLNSSRTNSMPC